MGKLVVAVVVVVFLGLLVGFMLPRSWSCTESACPSCSEKYTAELGCSSCVTTKTYVVLGIFNLVETCNGQEVVICENLRAVERRYKVFSGTCKMETRSLGNLFNPELE